MTWSSRWIVPRSVVPLLSVVPDLRPRKPQFDDGVHPQAEVPAGDVAPDVANLLLSGSMDFLYVVESSVQWADRSATASMMTSADTAESRAEATPPIRTDCHTEQSRRTNFTITTRMASPHGADKLPETS